MGLRNIEIARAMAVIKTRQETGRTITDVCSDPAHPSLPVFYDICRRYGVDLVKKRASVPLEAITEALKTMTVWKVSRKFSVPESIVKDIKMGKPRKFYVPLGARAKKQKGTQIGRAHV